MCYLSLDTWSKPYGCLSKAWHQRRRIVLRSPFCVRRSDGQALVEMALVLLLALTIIFGGIGALQAIGTHYAVNQAVRVAAHQAALLGSTGGLEAGRAYPLADAPGPVAEAARTAFAGSAFADSAAATISARCAADPCRRYSAITVRLTYQGALWTPIPGLSEVTVDRSAVRTAEKDAQ